MRDDRPITGQGEARRGDGREELLLRRGPLALLHTVDVQRDVHGARDRRRRAALAGLDLAGSRITMRVIEAARTSASATALFEAKRTVSRRRVPRGCAARAARARTMRIVVLMCRSRDESLPKRARRRACAICPIL